MSSGYEHTCGVDALRHQVRFKKGGRGVVLVVYLCMRIHRYGESRKEMVADKSVFVRWCAGVRWSQHRTCLPALVFGSNNEQQDKQ